MTDIEHEVWREENEDRPHPREHGCQDCVDPEFCMFNGDCVDLWVLAGARE